MDRGAWWPQFIGSQRVGHRGIIQFINLTKPLLRQAKPGKHASQRPSQQTRTYSHPAPNTLQMRGETIITEAETQAPGSAVTGTQRLTSCARLMSALSHSWHCPAAPDIYFHEVTESTGLQAATLRSCPKGCPQLLI